MKTQSSRGIRVLVFALLLGLTQTLSAYAQGGPGGTWKWSRTTPDGQTQESTLVLKLADGKLTGTVNGPFGEAAIEEAKTAGDDVSFSITRDFNGQKFVMKYQGKLAGDTLKGTISFDRDGQVTSRDWEAKREKTTASAVPVPVPAPAAKPAPDLAGTWKWSFTPANGDPIESTLNIKVVDGKLSGTLTGRGGQTAIEEAKLGGDVFSFTVTRERNGEKFVMKYQGKLEGDTLKGTTTFDRGGQNTSRDWEAKREKAAVAVAAAQPAVAPAVAAAKPAIDPAGTWKWSRTSQSGQTSESSLTIKTVDGKLSGTLTTPRGATVIAEVKIANVELSFSISRNVNGTTMTSKYAGKISGDEITGTIQSGSGDQARQRDWAAKREKTAAPVAKAQAAPEPQVAAVKPAADPAGTWKWTFNPPNGDPIESTLNIKQENGKLAGTLGGPFGEMAIEEAKLTGDLLTFTMSPEFNGQKMVIKYQGKLAGDTLKGTITFDRGDQPMSLDWEAKREKAAAPAAAAPTTPATTQQATATKPAADPSGTWKWARTTPDGQKMESTLTLKVAEGKVAGTVNGPLGEAAVEATKVTGDELNFQVTREFNGEKYLIKYQGKLTGDTLKGTTSFERDGQTTSLDWEATREKTSVAQAKPAPAAVTPAKPAPAAQAAPAPGAAPAPQAVAAKPSADLAGTWKWTVSTPDEQTLVSTLALRVVDGKLAGTCVGPLGEAALEEAKVAGNEISFRLTDEVNGEKIVLKSAGTQDGDTLKGTLAIEHDGQSSYLDWTAQRETSPAPAPAPVPAPAPAPVVVAKAAPAPAPAVAPAPVVAAKPGINPTGSWKWVITTPDEQKIEARLALKLDGGKLSGKFTGPMGEAAIEEARIDGDEVSFSITREINGEQIVLRSRGTQNGDRIKGSLLVARNGESSFLDWEAVRESTDAPVVVASARPGIDPTRSVDPTGAWKWSFVPPNGEPMEYTLNIKMEDGKLTGKMIGPRGETAIEDAKVVGDEISFSITRDFNGEKVVSKYGGKLSGNEITGMIAWAAKRAQ